MTAALMELDVLADDYAGRMDRFERELKRDHPGITFYTAEFFNTGRGGRRFRAIEQPTAPTRRGV